MEDKDFLNKMENLKKPEVNAETSQRQIKIVLLNARRSAGWGIWFLVVPVFFFCSVILKYVLHSDWSIAGNFLDWMAAVDKSMPFPIVSVFLFVVLPAVGAVINLLSILHFAYDKAGRELIVTFKIKWANIILAVISLGVIAVIMLYAISENSAERAIKKYEREWRSK
jgi:NADH:ubiquinone oxidoreductase subunit 6 (subunit J)